MNDQRDCHGSLLRKIPEHKITGEIYQDFLGNLFCAECYSELVPPYPGPGRDPQLEAAYTELILVSDHEHGNHPEPHWHRGCPLCEPRKPLSEEHGPENHCTHCGADWTGFRWEGDKEPPCTCDLMP